MFGWCFAEESYNILGNKCSIKAYYNHDHVCV